jgi:hypothetical protein
VTLSIAIFVALILEFSFLVVCLLGYVNIIAQYLQGCQGGKQGFSAKR